MEFKTSIPYLVIGLTSTDFDPKNVDSREKVCDSVFI